LKKSILDSLKISRSDVETDIVLHSLIPFSGFKSSGPIGTVNENGISNISVFNSIVHIGAFPPLSGMGFRPDTVRRHTLENILASKHYTINQVHSAMLPMAHLASAKFDDEISEFSACSFS
jgi:flavin reductase (DIM6/NTAB) family NADH-FMN oxidoreductase RutF